MDYFTRYGLEFNPFIKNSKEILVDTSEYKETLFRLDYLAKTKGFGLLTGSAGRGKTTTIRSWAASLNPSLYKVIYSSLSTLTPNDFYRNLVRELGNEPAFKKPDNFRIIQEEITRLAVEKRKTPVIIIDEANYINNAILNDLKILFNFEMDSRDRAAILLAGLPKLNSTLQLQIHEPKDEGKNYILEKLKGAGCNQVIFEDAAIGDILNAADGTPRLIDKYCNASILIGDSNKANLITTDIVMQALNDCELG